MPKRSRPSTAERRSRSWGRAVASAQPRPALVAKFSKDTGIKVKVVPHPAASDASYAQLARMFSSKSSSFDVMMLDVVFPGAFAPYLFNLKTASPRRRSSTPKGSSSTTPSAASWSRCRGSATSASSTTARICSGSTLQRAAEDLGGARHDGAEDPGRRAGDNPGFAGFVYQGNAYEGLTCDALEWFASNGGGHFIDGGKVTINNPLAAAMLNLQRSWVGNISPRGVTTYQESESQAFTAGNAAFMRNWPYMYAIGRRADQGQVRRDSASADRGERALGTLGGWQLGVSSFSKRPGAASSSAT